MKTLTLRKKLNLRKMAFATILFMAVFAISCDKAADDYVPTVSENMDLKSEKAVKKTSSTITDIAISLATAEEGAEFTQLVAALVYVSQDYVDENGNGLDLVGFFAGTDQYTVFAPIDAAFQNLYDSEELEALLNKEVNGITDIPVEIVKDVLLYHVTDGRRAANSVVPKNSPRMIETLLGATFSVDNSGKIWAVGNTANIVGGNAASASNGIIHVIDSVILPIEL